MTSSPLYQLHLHDTDRIEVGALHNLSTVTLDVNDGERDLVTLFVPEDTIPHVIGQLSAVLTRLREIVDERIAERHEPEGFHAECGPTCCDWTPTTSPVDHIADARKALAESKVPSVR